MSDKLKPIVTIIGPTASGKTELGLSLAKKFGGEIVSGDSMQIYKEFEISTAKPNFYQMQKVKHYMINILSVEEEFSAAKFKSLASECIDKILERNKLPFLVGGTGLYIDSVLKNTEYDFNENNSKKSSVDLTGLGNIELMEILKKIDIKSAEKIHINDLKRLRRAIEFFYCTGYPISEQVENSHKIPSPYKSCKIGLNFKDRDILYERINNRVDKMFELGIVDEVKRISTMKIGKTAKSAIGYKELLDFIEGKCSLDCAKENLKQATRRYAKRQLTWFRRDKEINWIYCDEFNDFSSILGRCSNIVNDFLNEFEG